MIARREFFAAVPVAACAFATDVAILYFLVERAGLHYLAAASAAFALGTAVAYLLSIRFVFRHRRLDSRHAEFAGFATIGVVGLAVNAAMIWLAVERFDLHYLLGKVGAAGCTFVFNLFWRKLLLFTPAAALFAFRGKPS